MNVLLEEKLLPLKSSKVFKYILVALASTLVSLAASSVDVYANTSTIRFSTSHINYDLVFNNYVYPISQEFDSNTSRYEVTYLVPVSLSIRGVYVSKYYSGLNKFKLKYGYSTNISNPNFQLITGTTSTTDFYISSTTAINSQTFLEFSLFLDQLSPNQIFTTQFYLLITGYSSAGDMPIYIDFSEFTSTVDNVESSDTPFPDSSVYSSIVNALQYLGLDENVETYLEYIYEETGTISSTYLYPIKEYISNIRLDVSEIKGLLEDYFESSIGSSGASDNESAAAEIESKDAIVESKQSAVIDQLEVDSDNFDSLGSEALTSIQSHSNAIGVWSQIINSFASASGFFWTLIVLSLVFGLFLFVLRLRS